MSSYIMITGRYFTNLVVVLKIKIYNLMSLKGFSRVHNIIFQSFFLMCLRKTFAFLESRIPRFFISAGGSKSWSRLMIRGVESWVVESTPESWSQVMSRGVDSWVVESTHESWSRVMSRGVDSKMLLAQFWPWSRGVDFRGVVDSWSPELCNRAKFQKW